MSVHHKRNYHVDRYTASSCLAHQRTLCILHRRYLGTTYQLTQTVNHTTFLHQVGQVILEVSRHQHHHQCLHLPSLTFFCLVNHYRSLLWSTLLDRQCLYRVARFSLPLWRLCNIHLSSTSSHCLDARSSSWIVQCLLLHLDGCGGTHVPSCFQSYTLLDFHHRNKVLRGNGLFLVRKHTANLYS